MVSNNYQWALGGAGKCSLQSTEYGVGMVGIRRQRRGEAVGALPPLLPKLQAAW